MRGTLLRGGAVRGRDDVICVPGEEGGVGGTCGGVVVLRRDVEVEVDEGGERGRGVRRPSVRRVSLVPFTCSRILGGTYA
jgi:hypothetical protein